VTKHCVAGERDYEPHGCEKSKNPYISGESGGGISKRYARPRPCRAVAPLDRMHIPFSFFLKTLPKFETAIA